MSRASLILIVLVIVLIGGAVLLANKDTEVAPVRVEKDMLNEAAAQ